MQRFNCFGLSLQTSCETESCWTELQQLIAPFPFAVARATSERVDLHLDVRASSSPLALPILSAAPQHAFGVELLDDGHSRFVSDGCSLFHVTPSTGVGQLVLHPSFSSQSILQQLNFFLLGLFPLLLARGFYDLHAAAAVARDDVGYLFVGASGSGKSKTALNLVAAGWDYLSDDAVMGPLRQNRLRRSLLLYTFLRRVGVDVDVCMGVKRVQPTAGAKVAKMLDGHAWLLRDEQPFLEPCARLPVLYTVTYRYPSALLVATNNVQSAAVTREMRLLLACARQSLSEHAGQEVNNIVDQNIDWPALVELAGAHGLLHITCQALKTCAPAHVPPEIVAQRRQQLLANAAHNTWLAHELTQLVALFAEADVDVLAYKGPVLATLLYGSVAPRRFNDLDLLVRVADVAKAQAILLSRGYRSRLQLKWEHSFVCDDDQRMVDLHWAFTGSAFRFVLDFDTVWQAAQRVTINNKPVATLGLQDTLLLLCINGAKDDWVLLSQVYEIGQFVKTYPLDWDALLVRAKALGCERVVLVGLWLAQALFAAPLPARLMRAIQTDNAVHKVGTHIVARLTGAPVDDNAMTTEQTRAMMRERLRDRLPIYQRMLAFIVSPNEKDRAFVSLPRGLAWLYALVRPVRLMIKHSMHRNMATRSSD